jgi:hypothetical protein
MSIHLLATMHVYPGKSATLLDVIQNRLVPIMQDKAGWKLIGCYQQQVGRLNTIIDLWELRDHNHLAEAFALYREDPDYPAIRVLLDQCVEQEVLSFIDKRF